LAIRIIEFALFVKTYFLPDCLKTGGNGTGACASRPFAGSGPDTAAGRE
jgi:hypothetical protein